MNRYGRIPIKASVHEEGVVDVLGCPFYGPSNGADVDGEFFSPNTNFMPEVLLRPPVFYFHGSTTDSMTKMVGDVISRWTDKDGVWYRVQLSLEDKPSYSGTYARHLWRAAQEGNLYASSGAVDASVLRDDETGEITQWLVGELSLMDMNKAAGRYPANSYAVAYPSQATYRRMSKSGRRLFGETFTRRIPKKKEAVMNEEMVIQQIEEAAFAVLDWYTASIQNGNPPSDEAVLQSVTESIKNVLSESPQLIPDGETVESILSTASEALVFDMSMIGEADYIIDSITLALAAAIPAIDAPVAEEEIKSGEDEDNKKGGEPSVLVEVEAVEESPAHTNEGAIEPATSPGSTSEGSVKALEGNGPSMTEPSVAEQVLSALKNPDVLNVLKSALSGEVSMSTSKSSTKAAKPSTHTQADQGFVDALVSAGTMKEAEQADILSLFGSVRDGARNSKSGPVKAIQSLRGLVARAYTVDGTRVVGFNGESNQAGESEALRNMRRFSSIKTEVK